MHACICMHALHCCKFPQNNGNNLQLLRAIPIEPACFPLSIQVLYVTVLYLPCNTAFFLLMIFGFFLLLFLTIHIEWIALWVILFIIRKNIGHVIIMNKAYIHDVYSRFMVFLISTFARKLTLVIFLLFHGTMGKSKTFK